MKFFQHIIDETDSLESYRILGVTLMEKATVRYSQERPSSNKPLKKDYKRFLGRIVYKAKYYNINGLFKKEISIFSIPIFGTLRLNGYKLFFILGIKIYSRPLKFLSDFKLECVDGLDIEYDDIYILLHHLGDAFRMLTIIKEIIKNKKSKNPMIMVFDDSFVDLIKMMKLGIPFIKIQTNKPFKERLESQFSTDIFFLGSFRFILLWNKWWAGTKYFAITKTFNPDTHSMLLQAAAHNVSYNKNTMGKVEIIPDAERVMLEKCKYAGLNLNNFIFMAPESFAIKMYNENFWEQLIGILQKNGYDVFLNIVACKGVMKKNSYANDKARITHLNNINNVKSFFLTIAEAYALACKAKKIITQRSGFSELLVQTQVPMCVIYTGNNINSAERMKKIDSLLMSPFANPKNIYEINVIGLPLNESLKAVTNSLCL